MYGFNSMGGIIPFLAMSKRWQFCQEVCLKTHSLKTGMNELNQFDSYIFHEYFHISEMPLQQVKKKGWVTMERIQFLCGEMIGWKTKTTSLKLLCCL